jgi:hypothetical protein
MINLPYNEILNLIKEKTNLSEDEINAKVNDKLNQLSGLISKEGAAHIIANELNVSLAPKEGEALKIKNVVANVRNLTLVGKVQQKYELREFNSARGPGKVGSFLLGDETGVIRVVLWNDQADLLEKFNEGDVLKIGSAYSRDNNGRKEVHVNDMSQIEVNPAGANVGEVKKREEALRKKISDLSAEDQNIEVMGTIVQVFDIRFFEVDPNTKRRIRPSDDGNFYDNMGNAVQPDYSYVSNVFIDDGSSNIRVVCFKNQLENLLNKKEDDILQFRENTQLFESVKHELLGHIVKIRGRVVNNDMFNRLELVSNLIIRDPNPQEEINRLAGGDAPTNKPVEQKPSAPSVAPVTPAPKEEPEVMEDIEETSSVYDSAESENDNSEDSIGDEFFEGNPEGESVDSLENVGNVDDVEPTSEGILQEESDDDFDDEEEPAKRIPDSDGNITSETDDSLDDLENIEDDIGEIDEEIFDEDEDPLK